MADMAKKIKVLRQGKYVAIFIDGQEFPWFTMDGVQVRTQRDSLPAITITIPAHLVEVEDSLPTVEADSDRV